MTELVLWGQSRRQGYGLCGGAALDLHGTGGPSLSPTVPSSAGDNAACHLCGQLKPATCLLPRAARGEKTQAHWGLGDLS